MDKNLRIYLYYDPELEAQFILLYNLINSQFYINPK